jgi:hypothetical protein
VNEAKLTSRVLTIVHVIQFRMELLQILTIMIEGILCLVTNIIHGGSRIRHTGTLTPII